MTAQSSFQTALIMELPERIPDLVLIDVQKDQAAELEARIADTSDLFGLQSMPNLRTLMLAVNGVPAEEALVLPEKAWVIEGDRSFSWAAEPTGAELLAGEWWPNDYNGPPLISAEEDVYEAFDLKVGDTITYSVFGRTFTSTVANIRKEYHRTFRPEFLLVASPNPFQNAPHGWVLSLQGSGPDVVNGLIRDLAATAANITTIDVRQIINQVTGVVNGVVAGTLAIAGALLLGGVLTLAAVVAGDVDSRRRDALAFTLVGVSRMEVARIRLTETVIVGVITAVLGGILGNIGGYWLVYEALRVEWAPGAAALMVPVLLGIVAAVAAAIAAGIGAVPRGRGQLVRVLAN